MIPLGPVWILMTVTGWTFGPIEALPGKDFKVLYPSINSNEAVDCQCEPSTCDYAFWFRTVPDSSKVEFLGRCNNADRVSGPFKDKGRFKFSRKGLSFELRIINVTAEDAGIYSCVLSDKQLTIETFRPGTLLLPGVTPPTLPPTTTTKKPVRSPCLCKNKTSNEGCDSRVLWPLVGVLAGLALTIFCTLYYFSRLPKKCHHHFVKKRLMS
uniref:Cd8 beta n=1 Tax=Oryzias sinensis TaxID=183150 RepID=A0A8C7ZV83_9TELE